MKLYTTHFKMTDRELAKSVELTENQVRSWRKRNGVEQYKPYDRRLTRRLELYEMGYSDRQIAEIQGVIPATIEQWRIYRRLPKHKDKRRRR